MESFDLFSSTAHCSGFFCFIDFDIFTMYFALHRVADYLVMTITRYLQSTKDRGEKQYFSTKLVACRPSPYRHTVRNCTINAPRDQLLDA